MSTKKTFGMAPSEKALEINLDNNIYGTFAEIGAGQEVVRHFFRAGGAAGTIAKAISAYDMTVSDTIYGKESSGRYVCEARLQKMLNREYAQINDRLSEVRSKDTRYFAFADTVAARSYSYTGGRDSHGWLGVRFQHQPKSLPNDVIIHVKMFDNVNFQQQEALGAIGVNLVHACYNHHQNREDFITALMDGLSKERIGIDMIRVSGPAFEDTDSRLWCLELVKRNLCDAIMFDQNGKVLQVTDELYKKNIVVSRGSFRPPTLVNMDMLKTGLDKFKKDLEKEERKNILVLPEISMNKLIERGEKVDSEDFLARVELLAELDQAVLISNFKHYYELNKFLLKYSKKKVGFVLGIYNLEEILNPAQYNNGENFFESLGALIGTDTSLYVYPAMDDDKEGELRTIETINIPEEKIHLLLHLYENKLIQNIKDFDESISHIWSRTVLKMIQNGDDTWEEMVPLAVKKAVMKKCLFGAIKCDL